MVQDQMKIIKFYKFKEQLLSIYLTVLKTYNLYILTYIILLI